MALQKARAKLEAAERAEAEPIAIIGMSCRFPGAPDPDAFWSVLREGIDTVAPIPADRWDAGAFYDPKPGVPGKTVAREAALLPAVDQFDCQFFGISPREAAMSIRSIACCWRSAGSARRFRAGGRSTERHPDRRFHRHRPERSRGFRPTLRTSTRIRERATACAAPGRLSYFLGLRGPSLAIDTACSSSLVAVHLACKSLRAASAMWHSLAACT